MKHLVHIYLEGIIWQTGICREGLDIIMNLIAKKFHELTTTKLYEILKARSEIFIMEQNIHYQDMDDVDYVSLHCYFTEDKKVIAYLRAFYKEDNIVKLGRVLTLQHGNGIGKALLEQSLIAIKEKMKCTKICMDAQKYALAFYEKFGFKVTSEDFLEEGIVHNTMELNVSL